MGRRGPFLGTLCLCRARLTSLGDPSKYRSECECQRKVENQADFSIDLELVSENCIPTSIDLISSVAIVLCPGIDGTPLSIPDTKPPFVHPLPLALIGFYEPLLLRVRSCVWLRGTWESKDSVVMDGVGRIPPSSASVLRELCKIRREGISVQENDMVLVDGSNSLMKPVVQVDQAFMLWVRICRFVQDVVSGDPGIIFVVRCELFPEPDEAILEVFVSPEVADMGSAICVPSSTLTTWCCVNVDDGVDGMFGAEGDRAVEVLEAVGLENSRVEVV